MDVAASPIDSALDYEIPEHFQDIVQAGIRVIVPLGPRKVMGFVVGLTNHSEFDQLKPIQEVMDYTPILTKELINLSSWLRQETLCFRISALQAMLPAVFKASYDKEVWLLDEMDSLPASLQKAAGGREVFPFNDLSEAGLTDSQVKQYIKGQLIDIKYVVKGKIVLKRIQQSKSS